MIDASLVKKLREQTGVGMMDCKKALTESNGDFESAVEWLRKKGLATASKKSDRVAAEGIISVAVSGNKGCILEINAETDFVSRNEKFQEFCSEVSKIALEGSLNLDSLLESKYKDGNLVKDVIVNLISTIGENLKIRRVNHVSIDNGFIASYVHGAVAPNLGKIGAIAAIESKEECEFGKHLCMHIAASSVLSLDVSSLDPVAVEKERNFVSEQAKSSGRPDDIVAKMVEGRMKKYYQEVVLLEQPFLVDPDITVFQASQKNNCTVKAFEKYVLGDGIEKESSDFASEVAKMVK
jgi:elongation factor Ts